MQTRDRLDPSVFRLPVQRIREGYYSDAYFVYTKRLLEEQGRHPRVLMQVFQKQESLLGGIDEAIAVLKLGSGFTRPDGGWVEGWKSLDVRALHEADTISAHETVMTIEGDYSLFAHLETVYLGLHGAPVADHAQRRGGRQRSPGKADLLFPGSARSLARADR